MSSILYFGVIFYFISQLLSAMSQHKMDFCKMCSNPGSHTMCLYPQEGPNKNCTNFGNRYLTEVEKQLIVDFHNEYRNKVALGRAKSQPQAANMRQVSWDKELEIFAQRWADQCHPVHDPHPHDRCKESVRFRVGQNIVTKCVTNQSIPSIRSRTMEWYNEIQDYNPQWIKEFKGSPNPLKKIGHYTQLVWAESFLIGCGLAVFGETVNGKYCTVDRLVCDYGPTGNVLGSEVYKVGEPCSSCPYDTQCSTKYEGLCVEKQPAVPQVYQRWKSENPWLALNDRQLMICTICTEATNAKLIINFSLHDLQSKETWVETGFGNWKHGAERIKTHAKSWLHINCAEALKSRDKVIVVQHLSMAQQKQMMDHRSALRKFFSTLKILGSQGLAVRELNNDENFNFMAILKARAEDVVELESWLQKTSHKWLHHDIQNEILEAMASEVMLQNLQEIKNAEYFSIFLDETADIAKMEQVSIYLRIVSADLIASEYFVGFYSTANTKAETLFDIVKDVLVRFDLPLSKLRGQCYDGASNVSGKISGLQQWIREEEPRALFVHCNAHNLNLVVQDGVEKVLLARKFIGEVKDLINFVLDSPKRVAKFQALQAAEKDESERDIPALAAYCPTRWVVRIKSLKTVWANYKVLMTFFQELFQDPDVDSSVAAKASGFLQRMESFEFLYLLNTMIQIFDRIEVLNTDLQQSELSVVDFFRKIEAMTLFLESSRDLKFETIWLDSNKSAQELDVEEPNLPRK